MTFKFTKLSIGNTVATVGGFAFKRLLVDSSGETPDVPDVPEEPDTPETYILSGTWVFKDIMPQKPTKWLDQTLEFTDADGNQFYGMSLDPSGDIYYDDKLNGGSQITWVRLYVEGRGWQNNTNRNYNPESLKCVTIEGAQTVSADFYNWFTANAKQALPAPTLSIDGDILTITSDSNYATEFDILVDGEVVHTEILTDVFAAGAYVFKEQIEAYMFRLDNFAFYSNGYRGYRAMVMQEYSDGSIGDPNGARLVYGDYNGPSVSVYNSFDGWTNEAYRTIDVPYNSNIYTGIKRWLYNNTVPYKLSGKWVFNSVLKSGLFGGGNGTSIGVNFTSNGRKYEIIDGEDDGGTGVAHVGYMSYSSSYSNYAYSGGVWISEAYRTVVFDPRQIVFKEQYEWVKANATPVLFTFSIEGVEYQAIEGMIWEDWVHSEYNTGGYYVRGDDKAVRIGTKDAVSNNEDSTSGNLNLGDELIIENKNYVHGRYTHVGGSN